jgi:hypothetical protein
MRLAGCGCVDLCYYWNVLLWLNYVKQVTGENVEERSSRSTINRGDAVEIFSVLFDIKASCN